MTLPQSKPDSTTHFAKRSHGQKPLAQVKQHQEVMRGYAMRVIRNWSQNRLNLIHFEGSQSVDGSIAPGRQSLACPNPFGDPEGCRSLIVIRKNAGVSRRNEIDNKGGNELFETCNVDQALGRF
jgi:hypothetical protein